MPVFLDKKGGFYTVSSPCQLYINSVSPPYPLRFCSVHIHCGDTTELVRNCHGGGMV